MTPHWHDEPCEEPCYNLAQADLERALMELRAAVEAGRMTEPEMAQALTQLELHHDSFEASDSLPNVQYAALTDEQKMVAIYATLWEAWQTGLSEIAGWNGRLLGFRARR